MIIITIRQDMSQAKRVHTQSSDCKDYLLTHRLVTEEAQEDTDTTPLLQHIHHLEHKLACAKQRELKLKVVNTQLSNMLISSSQASQRKTIDFITKVEDIVEQKMQRMAKINKNTGLAVLKAPENSKQPGKFTGSHLQKHEKRWSNFETRSSMGQWELVERVIEKQNRQEAMNKLEIKERMGSVKRIEKQLRQLNH